MILIVVPVVLKAPSHPGGLPTPLTTTTTREPAPPTTKEGSSDAQ